MSTAPVSPIEDDRLDEFCRELALKLRRITGRKLEPDLPTPISGPSPGQTSQVASKGEAHHVKPT